MSERLRILVLTRSYPQQGDLYRYPFVHRRLLEYAARGQDIAVFRPATNSEAFTYTFDGVRCEVGGKSAFDSMCARHRPQVIAVHGFSEQMIGLLDIQLGHLPVCAWLHGSEIPDIARSKALLLSNFVQRDLELRQVEARCEFWRALVRDWPDFLRLVLVSHHSLELARKDFDLPDQHVSVIPNPIDTDLFRYQTKDSDHRRRILMVRPFDHPAYGNDMAVRAILNLRSRAGFEELQFTIVGDGPHFDETTMPIRDLRNVRLHRSFLPQRDIAELHGKHGLFLVPTRLDTQGVSRDEAMSSGLVPITNRVAAVPEFVDDTCAALADPEDADGLAERLWEMVEQPSLLHSRSVAAAKRVRTQTAHRDIIGRELDLLTEASAWR